MMRDSRGDSWSSGSFRTGVSFLNGTWCVVSSWLELHDRSLPVSGNSCIPIPNQEIMGNRNILGTWFDYVWPVGSLMQPFIHPSFPTLWLFWLLTSVIYLKEDIPVTVFSSGTGRDSLQERRWFYSSSSSSSRRWVLFDSDVCFPLLFWHHKRGRDVFGSS